VILQADFLCRLSTLIVAPTFTSASPAIFRPEVEPNGKTTRVSIDQLRAVDTSRLGDFAGRLSPHEIEEIDDVLLRVLSLRR